MSDKLTREIKIKLSVDGKEVTGVLHVADEKLQQLAKNYTKYKSETETASKSTNTFALVLDQFKNELVEVSGTSENLTESVSDFIRMNGLSENQIADVINVLKQEKAALGVNTVEYQKYNQAIETITNAYGHARTGSGALTNTMKGTSSGVQAMSQTMGQLGWAIGDADMFLVNFRMGMMSIGNNIPMIAQGFGYVRDKIKDTGETMKDVLIGAIKGPGGVMIAINGLMFLINALAFLWDKEKKQIKENAEEVKNLANEYENLGKTQLDAAVREIKEVKLPDLINRKKDLEVERQVPVFDADGKAIIAYKTVTSIKDDAEYEKVNEDIAELEKRIQSLTGKSSQLLTKIENLKKGITPLNSINDIKEAIRLWNIELESVSTQKERNEIIADIEKLKELEKKFRNELKSDPIKTKLFSGDDYLGVQNFGNTSIKIPVELEPVDVEGNATQDDPWKPFEDTAWATAQNTAIQSIGQSIHNYIGRAFRKVIGDADNLFTNLIADVASALASLFTQQTAFGIFNLVSGGSGGFMAGFLNIGGKAEGGLIDGPGTETSDSILARLSKGEFVVKAKATKAFLPILEAINNYDKTNVRPLFQKFANGGLVGRSAQLISSLAGTSSVNVNLTMNPVELKQSGYDMRGVLKLIDRKEKKYR
ncbi:MAG: hypothetical protein CMF23_17795 [Ignavibacteriae bacterium]|nr:hypothetical protein [Ignavibacteriota bacterium]